VFRKARAAAPSIIFFDEVDAIGGARMDGGDDVTGAATTLFYSIRFLCVATASAA
jgi:AAA family ATPase